MIPTKVNVFVRFVVELLLLVYTMNGTCRERRDTRIDYTQMLMWDDIATIKLWVFLCLTLNQL